MTSNHLSRKKFLAALAKAGALGLLPGGVQAMSQPSHEKAALAGMQFLSPPYLQHITSSTAVVMWLTNLPASCWVEYGESTLDKKALPNAELGLLAANETLNAIKIEGLKSGTMYKYRVCSREIISFEPYKMTWGETITSDIFEFKTPDPKSKEVSWLVLNDIHDRPASFEHLFKLNGISPFDFVFLNGDMFDYQTDEQQLLDHLIRPLTALFASERPFMYARGNHETRGKFARQFAHYFTNPGNQFYFSFSQGPVHFIVLDTGEDKEDDHVEYSQLVAFDEYREKQARWLETELQNPAFLAAHFRVVMMHIPVFHSGEGHGAVHCRKLFNPMFNRAGIDLMICGHTHRYGVHAADQQTHQYPLVIGGGPKEGKRTLVKVKADRKQLVLQMIGDEGVEVGLLNLKSRR